MLYFVLLLWNNFHDQQRHFYQNRKGFKIKLEIELIRVNIIKFLSKKSFIYYLTNKA